MKGNISQMVGFGVATVGPRIVGVAMIPVLTAHLSRAEYGRFTLAETVAALIITVMALGLPASIVRTHSQGESDGRVATLFASIFVALLLGTAVIAVVGPPIWQSLPLADSLTFFPYVFLALLAACGQQLLSSAQSLYQARKQAWRFAAFAVGQSVILVPLTIWLLVGLKQGDVGVLSARMAAAVFAGLVAFTFAVISLKSRPQRDHLRPLLLYSLPLVAHQLVAFVLSAGDRFVIEFISGLDEVGIYSVAYSFGASMSLMTTIMMLFWAPRFFATIQKDRTSIAATTLDWLAVLAATTIIAMAASPPIVQLLTDAKFQAAAGSVSLIMGGYFFHACFSLFSLQILHSGKTAYVAQITVFAAIGNIAANFALVPYWGAAGAAMATLIAFALEGFAIYVFAQRIERIDHDGRVYVFIGTAVAAGAFISWLAPWPFSAGFAAIACLILWKTNLSQIWVRRRQLLG